VARTFHIGTYEASGGKGLVPVMLDAEGSLEPGEPDPCASNASYAVRAGNTVYLTDEREQGMLAVLRDKGGNWYRVARLPTFGSAPCFVECDGKQLVVANYASGSVALWQLGEDGVPQEPPALFQSHGSGPNPERQQGPHSHCVRFSPDGEALYAVDLGADTIWRLPLRKDGQFGQAEPAWRAPPGTGPRQLLFLPGEARAVLLSELASMLTLFALEEDGTLRELQTVSTLPEGFRGKSLGGHLALLDGQAIVSNRGHNSLALFALAGDQLELAGHAASGGAHPRHFAQVDRHLVVAHEKDGRVTSFDLSPGQLPAATGRSVRVPGACFVLA
jgi:6-phosphogluconolactonase